MYNNPYSNLYNVQPSIDRINAQINELQKMKDNLQQPVQPAPTSLTQNFQLAPTNKEVIRYAGSIDEVQRDMVMGDTPYFSKDMTVVWVKNTKGEIKTYELNEIIPKDDKDIKIELLMAQISELKKEIKYEHNANPFKRHIADCVIRSLSVLTNKSWNQVYDELTDLAGDVGMMFDRVEFVEDYLDQRYPRECHDSITVGEFAREHPYGKYAITMDGHITALVRGKLIDTFNPSNRVMRCAWRIDN